MKLVIDVYNEFAVCIAGNTQAIMKRKDYPEAWHGNASMRHYAANHMSDIKRKWSSIKVTWNAPAETVSVEKVARDFSRRLVTLIGKKLLRKGNPEEYCDTNEVMYKALKRQGISLIHAEDRPTVDLWNSAWKLAEENGYWVNKTHAN